jgi:hypothetical protein
VWTLPPQCKYVKAVDKGVTAKMYGKATNKGLTEKLTFWSVLGRGVLLCLMLAETTLAGGVTLAQHHESS